MLVFWLAGGFGFSQTSSGLIGIMRITLLVFKFLDIGEKIHLGKKRGAERDLTVTGFNSKQMLNYNKCFFSRFLSLWFQIMFWWSKNLDFHSH